MKNASSDLTHLRADYTPDQLGTVESETDDKFDYEATVRVDEPSTVFLKATFHPDWHVYVNGEEVKPFMLAPSFPAIHLEPGTYDVTSSTKPTRCARRCWHSAFLRSGSSRWVTGSVIGCERASAGHRGR